MTGKDELPVGSHVLALFPTTTCFYSGKVVKPPSKVREIHGAKDFCTILNNQQCFTCFTKFNQVTFYILVLKNKESKSYVIKFEDDENFERLVPADMVLLHPGVESRRKSAVDTMK